ncbi:hypothetical protein EYR38_003137 [Pleurotus pulmonarius]|nr:hypothetical protein EYR38_003137 [Pleurotus pulmonarius]
MGWSWLFAMMEYGKAWKHHRKLFQKEFHSNAATSQFHPQLLKHTTKLLQRLLGSPDDFMEHMNQTTVAIIMDIGYAIDVSSKEDPHIVTAEKALTGLNIASLHGAFLVESIPLLKYVPAWMPGAGFQQKAKEWKYYTEKMVKDPFEVVKERMASGIYQPCFTSRRLEDMNESEDIAQQERLIQETAGNLYTAGADTTTSALISLVLAFLIHPDIQEKARREIDGVLEGKRLPNFEDMDQLPYVTAVAREVQRWQPVTPLAIPHFVTDEDEYKGYRIPANSIVIGNAWAMLHDETKYAEPFAFKPERWLSSDGTLNPDMKEPSVMFGFGRRICPGRYLASSSIWITAAMLLSVFEFTHAIDQNGHRIEPSQKYCPGLIPFDRDSEPQGHSFKGLQIPDVVVLLHQPLCTEPKIGFSLKRTKISHLVEQFYRTVTKGDGQLAYTVQALSLGRVEKHTDEEAPVQDDTCLTAALLLSLRNLKHLEVLYHGVTLAPPTVDPSCQFTSITHLCWSAEVKDAASFASFLASLPSLEYLMAGGDDIGSIPLAPTALPLLRHLVSASFELADSILVGRQVSHLGVKTNNIQTCLSNAIVKRVTSPPPVIASVQALSINSDEIHLIPLTDPLRNLSELAPYVGLLRETKVEFLSFETVSDDDGRESAKDLFAALPSLKTFDFQRLNDDAEDGFHRFRRDKLNDEPEWIEEELAECDQRWTDIEAESEEVKE